MKRRTFTVKFHQGSAHWVGVEIHSSQRAMRARRSRLGKKNSRCSAFCVQNDNPSKDGCIATIHLARNSMTLDDIAHEASHAAHHRTVLLGVPRDADEFQEWVAWDTGVLTDAILAYLDQQRIAVRYQTVPSRKLKPRKTWRSARRNTRKGN